MYIYIYIYHACIYIYIYVYIYIYIHMPQNIIRSLSDLSNYYQIIKYILVGGFNPSETYQSIGMIIPNIWKKHVPNHQPDIVSTNSMMLIGPSTGWALGGPCAAATAACPRWQTLMGLGGWLPVMSWGASSTS